MGTLLRNNDTKCQKNDSWRFYTISNRTTDLSIIHFFWRSWKNELTWHVVVSVTPHTIRWIPSTQTFNSITIRPVCAIFFSCKINVFLFIFGVVVLLLLLLLIHAALQPPRDIMTLSYLFYPRSLVFLMPIIDNQIYKKLNVIFNPFKVSTASRFGVCNTSRFPQ